MKILILEGLPGSGKSTLVKSLKKKIKVPYHFSKIPFPKTREKIMKKGPKVNISILGDIYKDIQSSWEQFVESKTKIFIIERYILSTLITYFNNYNSLRSIRPEMIIEKYMEPLVRFHKELYYDIRIINVKVPWTVMVDSLRIRKNPFYDQMIKRIPDMIKFESQSIQMLRYYITSNYLNCKIENVNRSTAEIRTAKFLGGKYYEHPGF